MILSDQVVQNEWAASLSLVNAPSDLKQVEPGQCVRFGVLASGDERDQLLKSAKFSFALTREGKKETFPAEPALALKQIKPEGGDFVTQALGVARIKNPVLSMVSLAASRSRWCAPRDVQDGSATVVGQVVLENGESVTLNPGTFVIKTFKSARKMPPFADTNTLGTWLQRYHRAPDPAHLLTGLQVVAADPKSRSAYNIMAFFVAALKADPAATTDVIESLKGEQPATRIYAIPLLRAAGCDVQPLLIDLKDDEKLVLGSLEIPNAFDLTPNRMLPNKMDMLWAEFFASGRIEPVKAVASMLAWREDYDKFNRMRESGQKPKELTDSIMRGVVYTAAGWSLRALSRSDGLVADYIDALKASPETPPVVKSELEKLYTNPAFNK